MVISEPALICLDTSNVPLLRGFAALWFGSRETIADLTRAGRARPPVPTAMVENPSGSGAGIGESVVASEEGRVTNGEAGDAVVPLTAQERRARAATLRGLLLGRQRRFDAAQGAFAEAARLDPDLKLESVPTFWDMERGAHEAAVRAYAEAGRAADASMLASRLRATFRPRLVNPRRSAPPTVS